MALLHIKLSDETIDHVLASHCSACRYWVPDAYTRTKDTIVEVMWDKFSRDVRKALRKRIPVHSEGQLRTLANFDRTSTDVIVQLALFGEIRYC